MEIFRQACRGAAIVLALTAVSACTATKTLPAGFYKPAAAPAAKLPLQVVVIADGIPAETQRSLDPIVMGKVKLNAYPQEVAKMLADIYQSVSVQPTAAQAGGADLRVSLGADYPRNISLTFHDGQSGAALTTLSERGVLSAGVDQRKFGFSIPYNIIFIPLTAGMIGIVEIALANKHANGYSTDIQLKSNEALQRLRERIRQSDELLLTPAEKAALQALELQANAALDSGDAVGALLGYQQCLEKVLPGGPRALALQAQAVHAALGIAELPPVPEQAQDLMARGKAALALAKTPADYLPASTAMERALTLAPWWATGHFNTALTQEGAGLWSSAAQHLKLFLQLDPQTPDREKIRLKIAELELHQERGDKPTGATAGR